MLITCVFKSFLTALFLLTLGQQSNHWGSCNFIASLFPIFVQCQLEWHRRIVLLGIKFDSNFFFPLLEIVHGDCFCSTWNFTSLTFRWKENVCIESYCFVFKFFFAFFYRRWQRYLHVNIIFQNTTFLKWLSTRFFLSSLNDLLWKDKVRQSDRQRHWE